MATESLKILVSGITVEVVRKDIKNLHLGVYPPNGRVRVAAPLMVSNEAVRLAVVDKLGWIKRHKARFAGQPRQSQREMVNGESHYFLGQRYRLQVHVHHGPAKVDLRGLDALDLFVRPETNAEQRREILDQWYRAQLKDLIPQLLEKWQPIIGVQVSDWGVKKMKTKWGSCSTKACRIWLNLELAKRSTECLEFILVHELVHILERHHNDRFSTLMDQFMPHWRQYREQLREIPLRHEEWSHSIY
ncbi:MAG: M48 family metallopeptidase [Proteobacteria bacterium]|nr:M48 family metallopeptidase [Pseudomonadota bacterium]MBU1595464.1 M48 family metallopeptidase [Pseudomonadota bacterium]